MTKKRKFADFLLVFQQAVKKCGKRFGNYLIGRTWVWVEVSVVIQWDAPLSIIPNGMKFHTTGMIG